MDIAQLPSAGATVYGAVERERATKWKPGNLGGTLGQCYGTICLLMLRVISRVNIA